VTVAVGVGEGVRVLVGVSVSVGIGVAVSVETKVGVAVGVGDGTAVGTGASVVDVGSDELTGVAVVGVAVGFETVNGKVVRDSRVTLTVGVVLPGRIPNMALAARYMPSKDAAKTRIHAKNSATTRSST